MQSWGKGVLVCRIDGTAIMADWFSTHMPPNLLCSAVCVVCVRKRRLRRLRFVFGYWCKGTQRSYRLVTHSQTLQHTRASAFIWDLLVFATLIGISQSYKNSFRSIFSHTSRRLVAVAEARCVSLYMLVK